MFRGGKLQTWNSALHKNNKQPTTMEETKNEKIIQEIFPVIYTCLHFIRYNRSLIPTVWYLDDIFTLGLVITAFKSSIAVCNVPEIQKIQSGGLNGILE